MKKNTVIEIISFLLVALFTYASVSKLIDFQRFKFQLGRSPFITEFSSIVAWFIPLSELIVVLLLILHRTRLLGLYGSFFLMIIFTGYIYAMLHFSYFIPCSCGGVLSSMGWSQHLIFNISFTLISLLGILLHVDRKAKREL